MNNRVRQGIHDYGQLMRFITPLLISIALYLLSNIQKEITKLDTHFTNHLFHHVRLEKEIEHRFTCLETLINRTHKEAK